MLVSACGGPSSETTDDPVGQNVAAAAASGRPAAMAAAVDCGNLPDFVKIHPGGQITQCVAGPDGQPRHASGSVVYQVDAQPDEVLGWSRAQADASGLGHRVSAPGKYEAGEEGKRTLMIVVEPMNGGTRATLNWGSEI
ncbi:MAG: hypothetical protein EOP61_12295 [Sphingomonadales bacterium]|nr:MAG: hypothetical protein EOP61_12295 [Sphingomonadales bacterium]